MWLYIYIFINCWNSSFTIFPFQALVPAQRTPSSLRPGAGDPQHRTTTASTTAINSHSKHNKSQQPQHSSALKFSEDRLDNWNGHCFIQTTDQIYICHMLHMYISFQFPRFAFCCTKDESLGDGGKPWKLASNYENSPNIYARWFQSWWG